MIPVVEQPEPATFDAAVRKPAAQWFEDKGIELRGPKPQNLKLPTFWRNCLEELHTAYSGICAYLCVFIVKPVGGATVEHFVPKSAALEDAYEWKNYRLASSKVNSRKREYQDVLDPFDLAADTFLLELVTGKIHVNPTLPKKERTHAQTTIDRLDLDDAEARQMRADWYTEYIQGHIDDDYLRRKSPFVWYEMHRQGSD